MKTCLVTGAAGGIGRAISRAFLREGWAVTATDVLVPDRPDDGVRFLASDLSEPKAISRLVEEAGLDRLDALVNNAGVEAGGPLSEMGDQQIDKVLGVNLRAPIRLIQELRGPLRRASGSIVNVSSVHALATSVNVAVYAASKAALVALTRAVALEWASDGIRCNAVLPGAVDTPMLRSGLARRGAAADLDDLGAATPLGRVGTPDEVAEAVLFLCDHRRSSFVTGQSLVVDGGALAQLSTERERYHN